MFGSAVNNKGKTEKNKKVKEGPCLFPFTYKWKSHDKCHSTKKGDICATSIDTKVPKRRTLKTYGYCKKPKITAPLSFRPVKRAEKERERKQYLDNIISSAFLKSYFKKKK